MTCKVKRGDNGMGEEQMVGIWQEKGEAFRISDTDKDCLGQENGDFSGGSGSIHKDCFGKRRW